MITPEYTILELPLDVARSSAKFEITGRVLQVLESTHPGDYLEVAFGAANRDRYRLREGIGIHIDFEQFYVSSAAVAGGHIRVHVGSDPSIQIFGLTDVRLTTQAAQMNSGKVAVGSDAPAQVLAAREGRRHLMLANAAAGTITRIGTPAALTADFESGIALPWCDSSDTPPYPLHDYEGAVYARSDSPDGAVQFLEAW